MARGGDARPVCVTGTARPVEEGANSQGPAVPDLDSAIVANQQIKGEFGRVGSCPKKCTV